MREDLYFTRDQGRRHLSLHQGLAQQGYLQERQSRKGTAEAGPLISSDILDLASQRLFIVSAFILIQSWKLYDLLLLKSDFALSSNSNKGLDGISTISTAGFLFKYIIIDGLFVWSLPILNIPYLRFSLSKTILFTIILNASTVFLVSSWAVPLLSNVFLPVWKFVLQKKELNIVGESINVAKAIDMDSHFKGQLTIHYLPDSSAKMNPFNIDQVCLGSENNFMIKMPIEFNSTSGIGVIQIQQITPDNEVRLHNYTGRALKKILKRDISSLESPSKLHRNLKPMSKHVSKSNTIFYAEYPITSPGSYRIKSVLDTKGNSIRTYKSEFVVAECPLARFYYPPHFDQNKKFTCFTSLTTDSFSFPWIETLGLTHVFVSVDVSLNKQEFKKLNISVGQDVVSSPKSSKTDISYLKPQRLLRNSLEENIMKQLNQTLLGTNSLLEFKLVSVQDTIGNLHRYQPLSKDSDVFYEISLRKSPEVGLFDSNPELELAINSSKKLSLSYTDIFYKNDFPLDVVVGFNNETEITKSFKSASDLHQGISISKPGSYQLLKVNDAKCPCAISPKNSVQVKLAPLPEINIAASPISDRCLGVTGYKFDFEFSGKPPFRLHYHIYSNETGGVLKPIRSATGKATREIISNSKSHSFEFQPPSEGNYAIVFNSIMDSYYHRHPIAIDAKKYTYHTYFRQVSEIGMQVRSRTVKTCYGVPATLPLTFKGNGPFSFVYDFVNPDTGKPITKSTSVTNVTSYSITTPPSLYGKAADVVLRSAKDRFGCDARMTSQSIRIISRPEIPEVEFGAAKENFEIVEGSFIEVPLNIKSSVGLRGSDLINLKFVPKDGDEIEDSRIIRAEIRSGSSVKLTKAGSYWLDSFVNDGCQGLVSHSERKITLSYFDRPEMKLSVDKDLLDIQDTTTISLKPVCNGCPLEAELQMYGKPPFLVDYELKLPSGRIESRKIRIDGTRMKVKLPTKEDGVYEHRFVRIYDAHYSEHTGIHIRPAVPKISYKINPLPNVKFVPDRHFSQICENKLKNIDEVLEVPVLLSGEYPFVIDATITNEETRKQKSIQFRNVNKPTLDMQLSNFEFLGDYSIVLNKIIDGNGCINTEQRSNRKYILSITEPPDIVSSFPEQKHYCVGDHVSYNVNGVYPVTVSYQYNDVNKEAKVHQRFIRLASKPGILHIKRLVDSGENSCVVDLSANHEKFASLLLQVHDLPSVEVNKGDYIVEDLHEGDQTELIFTFQGEPPFLVTYIRTIDVKKGGKKLRKLLEKETVLNIEDFEHVVLASLEGTYEAIEVRDKYCRAVKNIHYIE